MFGLLQFKFQAYFVCYKIGIALKSRSQERRVRPIGAVSFADLLPTDLFANILVNGLYCARIYCLLHWNRVAFYMFKVISKFAVKLCAAFTRLI